MSNRKRQSIELTEEEWRWLDTLAISTGSLASRGETLGKPSWRALIRRIAQNELWVTGVFPKETTHKGHSIVSNANGAILVDGTGFSYELHNWLIRINNQDGTNYCHRDLFTDDFALVKRYIDEQI